MSKTIAPRKKMITVPSNHFEFQMRICSEDRDEAWITVEYKKHPEANALILLQITVCGIPMSIETLSEVPYIWEQIEAAASNNWDTNERALNKTMQQRQNFIPLFITPKTTQQ